MDSNPSKIQRPDSVNDTITGSDEYKTSVKLKQHEFVCTTCARDNKHVNASNLCKICNDYLCFKCLLWHGKYRSDHVDDMVGLDEMRKLGVQEPPVMPAEKCVVHDGELWNMLCPKDGVAGCKRCMEQDHRSCGSAIPRSSRQIEAVNRQMKKASLLKNNTDDFEFQRNDAPLRQTSGGEIVRNSAEEPKRSDDGQVPGRKHLVDVDDFQVSGKLKIVGRHQITDSVDGSKQITKKSTTDIGQVPGIGSQQDKIYSVMKNREINVRIPSDIKTCDIFDLCLLSDGRLLMSDFKNKKIKLLDCNLNVIDHFDFPNIPTCICMINDTEAAVVVGRYIHFVTITSRIEMMRRIKLDHRCEGLAYSAGELYVSDGETNIHVYTVEGQKLRTMETGLRMSKPPKYRFEWLTVSKDKSRLILTNRDYGIVCLDRVSGEVVWKINDTDSAVYSGLCVDRNNNVLVCRRFKGDVVQFSSNGQLSGVIINDLQSTQSICMDEVRSRLFVGVDYSDTIRLFDMKT